MTATPTRSTAAVWRPGDPVGDRRFAAIGDLALERGGVLPDVTVAYETWGTLSPSGDNAVLVEHALTGDSHVVGDAGPGHASPGWWPGLIGPGRAARHRPPVRRREQRARRLPGHHRAGLRRPGRPSLGWPVPVRHRSATRSRPRWRSPTRSASERWHGVLGGSMGGMRVLEWVASHPDRVERALVLASTPYATADQVAWCQPQLLAIRSDPAFRGGDYYGQRRVAGHRHGHRAADRAHHLPARGRARRPVRPPAPGRGGPARGRRALRRRELPRPPRRASSRAASTRTATSC